MNTQIHPNGQLPAAAAEHTSSRALASLLLAAGVSALVVLAHGFGSCFVKTDS